jgi:hypothetical protein
VFDFSTISLSLACFSLCLKDFVMMTRTTANEKKAITTIETTKLVFHLDFLLYLTQVAAKGSQWNPLLQRQRKSVSLLEGEQLESLEQSLCVLHTGSDGRDH